MAEWMTLEELGRYLKISRASLYKKAQSHQIPSTKIGRSWRFDRESIDIWMRKTQTPFQKQIGSEFPWSDCLLGFIQSLQKKFENRFSSLWIYGSWARGEARPDSDVDLMVVLSSVKNFAKDFDTVASLAYESTFGKNRPVVFSITLTDQKTFISDPEPLLLNVRREGKKAA